MKIKQGLLGALQHVANNFYRYMVLAGFLIQWFSTIHYGWNGGNKGLAPLWDISSFILVFWGVVGDVAQGLEITKNYTNSYYPKVMHFNDQRGKNEKTNFVTTKKG